MMNRLRTGFVRVLEGPPCFKYPEDLFRGIMSTKMVTRGLLYLYVGVLVKYLTLKLRPNSGIEETYYRNRGVEGHDTNELFYFY